MSGRLLSARGISKGYPGVLAVDRVDFHVDAGEVVGLVGKNGAGKSTLIRVLAGVERADAGEIEIAGRPVPEHYGPHVAHELGLAFMHQELANVRDLSVAENVALGSRYPRRGGVFVARRRLQGAVREVLRQLDATIDPVATVGGLTVVQQRIVMIARALYHRAQLVVLDEPSASLAEAEVELLHAVVRTLRDGGASVVYVSHRLGEISAVTDRVVVMRDGRVALERATSELDRATLLGAIVGEGTDVSVIGQRRRAIAAPREDVLLRVRGLTRSGAVENVSFDLREGEILGIGGLVGSGRTELARLLFGADRATEGIVKLRGRELRLRSPRHAIRSGIALLPEDRRHEGLVLGFNVRQNMTLASLASHRTGPLPVPSRRNEGRTARRLVERLRIKTPSIEEPVDLLSGGNQQKVMFGRWLEQPVDVFVLDEATQGIDVHGKEEIFALTEEIAAQGKGVIFIASDFSELVALCHRVLVVSEGRVTGVLEGPELTEQAIVQLCYQAAEAA